MNSFIEALASPARSKANSISMQRHMLSAYGSHAGGWLHFHYGSDMLFTGKSVFESPGNKIFPCFVAKSSSSSESKTPIKRLNATFVL